MSAKACLHARELDEVHVIPLRHQLRDGVLRLFRAEQ